MINRVPPHNLDAEQSVLGSMLLSPDAILTARSILSRQDFYRESHGLLFEVMGKMRDESQPVDLVTIGHELQKINCLDKVGGVTYIASLANIVPTAANVEYYAGIVKEKSVARQIISSAGKIIDKAYGDYEDIKELLHEVEQNAFNLSLSNKTQEGLVDVYDITLEVVDEIAERKPSQGVVGIPTGFKVLDMWTAGFQGGQLIVIAARPSMGKTSWVIQLAAMCGIRYKKKVAVFSLETKRKKLVEKMLINQGMIDAQRIRLGTLNDQEIKKVFDTAGIVSKSGVMINDTADITIHEILSQCRKAKLEHGLDMVIVDYIQQISSKGGKNITRDREIGEISRSLKKMAMELDIPVVALSQLSRATEMSKDKRPSLSHLRESGSIEADADTVIFLHRPGYYFPDADQNLTEIIVAKQREGPVGTIEVEFLKQFTRFTDPVSQWGLGGTR